MKIVLPLVEDLSSDDSNSAEVKNVLPQSRGLKGMALMEDLSELPLVEDLMELPLVEDLME